MRLFLYWLTVVSSITVGQLFCIAQQQSLDEVRSAIIANKNKNRTEATNIPLDLIRSMDVGQNPLLQNIEAISATNQNFKLAVGYIVAEMMGHAPPKLPEGVTQNDLSNAYFQMFLIPQLAMSQKTIEFYGKAVDESNQPIEGAKIEFTWIHFFPPPQGAISTNAISDQQGQFSLSGVIGVSLNVRVSKDGFYDVKNLNRTNFAYSTSLNSIPFQPDSNNPVIFHLCKGGIGADLTPGDSRNPGTK
jgi:hypothetical protein